MSALIGGDVGSGPEMSLTSTTFVERATTFVCKGDRVVAISTLPELCCFKRGVLIVVGGPQYRAGSHRQFTLLSRMLAANGIAAMRFDFRGMGDSEGSVRSFEEVHDDLRAATDHFFSEHGEVEDVVLWGLCDAASAVLFYAQHDSRVAGLVLLNPWVRTAEGIARARVKGYYAKRVFDAGFWGKVFSGQFKFSESARSFVWNVAAAARRQPSAANGDASPEVGRDLLPQRMLAGWRGFRGRILLVLSGEDLTADEFRALVASDRGWKRAITDPRVDRCEVPGANHTFSRAEWRERVEQATARWVQSW